MGIPFWILFLKLLYCEHVPVTIKFFENHFWWLHTRLMYRYTMIYLTSFTFYWTLSFFTFFCILGNITMYIIVPKSVLEFLTIIRRGVTGSKGMNFLKTLNKLPYCFLERFVARWLIKLCLKVHFHIKASQKNQDIYVDWSGHSLLGTMSETQNKSGFGSSNHNLQTRSLFGGSGRKEYVCTFAYL